METSSDASPKPLSRVELLQQARELRIADADVMTRAELHAALERARRPEPRVTQQPATWLGVARRLLASIVEQGLHLPDAAAVIRGPISARAAASGPPPVATVTLARIYATQGHLKRAISTLDEVLRSDPDHDLARELRAQLATRWAEIQREEALAAAKPNSAKATTKSAGSGAPAPAGVTVSTPVPVPPSVRTRGEEEAPLSDTAISRGAPPPPKAAAVSSVSAAGVSAEPVLAKSVASESPPSESRAPDTTTPELESAFFESVLPPAPEPEAVVERDVFDMDTKVDHPSLLRRPAPEPEPLAPPSQLPPPPSLAEPGLPEPRPFEASPELTPREVLPPELGLPEASRPEPVPAEPRPAGLVLIQTGAPETYLYWELARISSAHTRVNGAPADSVSPASSVPLASGLTRSGEASEPHWISIVTHIAHATGSERRERRFPVFHAAGAVRLDGVPRGAVVRAKLGRGESPEEPPLVVAGLVWAAEATALGQAEARFAPLAADDPRALAQRAGAHLVKAAPIYW